MTIDMTDAQFELLKNRVQNQLERTAPNQVRATSETTGLRRRTSQSTEPAQLLLPCWSVYNGSGTGRVCDGCNQSIEVGSQYVRVTAVIPGLQSELPVAQFCGRGCLLLYCYAHSESDIRQQVKSLEEARRQEIARIEREHKASIAEAIRVKTVFCFCCADPFDVSGKGQSKQRFCEPCRNLAKTERERRKGSFCRRCGETFKQIGKELYCLRHLPTENEHYEMYRTQNGITAYAVPHPQGGYIGRIPELYLYGYQWNEKGESLRGDTGLSLDLSSSQEKK